MCIWLRLYASLQAACWGVGVQHGLAHWNFAIHDSLSGSLRIKQVRVRVIFMIVFVCQVIGHHCGFHWHLKSDRLLKKFMSTKSEVSKIDIGSPWAELLHRPSKVLLGPTRPQHTSSRPSLAGTKESNPDILLGRANKNKIRQKKVLRDGLVQAEDLVDLIGALGQTPIFTNEWFW